MKRLLVATTNLGKQREFRRLLSSLPAEIVTPDGIGLDLDVDEPHETYAENASAKARAFALASGLVSLADDSGIEVAALDWGPGVRSARWAGDRRAVRPIGSSRRSRESADRRARMVCALAVATPRPDGEPAVRGVHRCRWRARSRRRAAGAGDSGTTRCSSSTGARRPRSSPDAEKDRLSHRGRAVAAALPRLREVLGEH